MYALSIEYLVTPRRTWTIKISGVAITLLGNERTNIVSEEAAIALPLKPDACE
jgi:hypothetical protein